MMATVAGRPPSGAKSPSDEPTCKDGGQRRTAQRALLLELVHHPDKHLDAYALYRRARLRQPSISLSTVYRNLRLFKELGLVEEHRLDGSRRYYENRHQAKHHHLICLRCGRIIEFQCPLTEELKNALGKENDFQVTETEVRLAGYCSACRKSLIGVDSRKVEAAEEWLKGGDQDAVWKRLVHMGQR